MCFKPRLIYKFIFTEINIPPRHIIYCSAEKKHVNSERYSAYGVNIVYIVHTTDTAWDIVLNDHVKINANYNIVFGQNLYDYTRWIRTDVKSGV